MSRVKQNPVGKPYIQTTIDSDFSTKLHNILNEQFSLDWSDDVGVSDITYIWTFNGFVYLTSIMNLHFWKIIVWALNATLEAYHMECIEKAKKIRRTTHPFIIYIDRYGQYVSDMFRKATDGIVNSYLKKAHSWDNACIESFHALLKRE